MWGSIKRARLALCVIFSLSILLSAAGEALAASEVRLLHAVPGGAAAQLEISGGEGSPSDLEGVRFGEATEYGEAPSGDTTLTLMAGGEQLGRSTETLEDGARYTAVAVPGGDGATLRVYADGKPTPGRTRWRMVHAAPELDEAEFVLDDRVVGRLEAGSDTGYETVEPGTYSLTARRPGDKDAMVKSPTVDLVAGTAQTAYLVGSGGEPTRFVVLQDAASAPDVAPATGLGGPGSGEGRSWLLALLAAAVAGAGGGFAYSRHARG